MNIKPVDFLEARASLNYCQKVFNFEMTDEMYTFHIYNIAMQLSLISNRSEAGIQHMAEQGEFLDIMLDFKDRYWEIVNNSNNHS